MNLIENKGTHHHELHCYIACTAASFQICQLTDEICQLEKKVLFYPVITDWVIRGENSKTSKGLFFGNKKGVRNFFLTPQENES